MWTRQTKKTIRVLYFHRLALAPLGLSITLALRHLHWHLSLRVPALSWLNNRL